MMTGNKIVAIPMDALNIDTCQKSFLKCEDWVRKKRLDAHMK